MGAVYLAFDRERKTQVALKTLRRVDASGIYRFKREFRALADVSHRNLVVLHELFVEGAEWFFTMEYVPGTGFLDRVLGLGRAELPKPFAGDTRATRELRAAGDVLDPSPLQDADKLRDILSQTTEGLLAVHGAGQLHRDLKPDNVLVTPDDRVVVLDFGIAVERFADGDGTLDAGVMGTPAYMSPEQAAGVPVTEATDWYALGVMLFEALTARVPFDGDYMDVLRQKQRYDPPRPSHICTDIPEDLDELCASLLQRDPAARPRGEDVLAVLGGGPNTSERPQLPAHDELVPFVAREDTLRQLHGALRTTDEGKAVVVFMQGMTGMGKSALVDRFSEDIASQPNTVVLRGRCYEREMVPFKAFDSLVDALSRFLRRTPTINAADVMPRDIHALAQVFPVLRRVEVVNRVQRRHGLPSDLPELRRRAFGALKELLRRMADQHRVMLCIDDLQWGDVDSARLIADVITGADAPALLFVCTYRSGDVQDSPCLQTLFEQTRETGAADIRQLTVGPLHTDEIRTLARQLLKDDHEADLDALARESRGSPYVLSELIGHYQRSDEAGYDSKRPVSLDAALSEKLAALNEGPASLLEIIAVSGRPVSQDILSALTGEAVNLHDALERLRGDKLVRGVGGEGTRAVEIYHDGIRRAVLARMDESLVRRWHGRLANALEASGTPDLQALTEHLIGAEDFARAGIYAIRAATQASRAMAFDKAAQLYELAVKYHEDEAWQQELRVQWAEALINAGRSSMAAEVFIDAAEHASEEDALVFERRAGTELVLAGQVTRGYAVLRRTLVALNIKLDEGRSQALSRALLLSEHLKARGLGFRSRPEHLVDVADLERLDAAFQIQRAFFYVYPVRVAPLIAQHLIDCLDCGEPRRIVQAACAFYTSIESTMDQGDTSHGLQLAERLVKEARDPSSRAEVAMASGWHYQNRGLLAPALLQITQAEELFRTRCQGRAVEMRLCRTQMARLYQMLGRLDELRNVESWTREAEEREDRISGTHLRLLTAFQMLVEDRVDSARRALLQARERLSEQRFGISTLIESLIETQLALYTGDAIGTTDIIEDRKEAIDLWTIEPWRSDRALMAAQVHLTAALDSDPQGLDIRLRLAEESLAQLERLQRDYLADHVRLLRASIAHLRDDDAGAIQILEAILGDREQAGDGTIVLASARMRRGQLLGAEGRFEVEQAHRELTQRGVVDPERFVRLYAPGFKVTSEAIDLEA